MDQYKVGSIAEIIRRKSNSRKKVLSEDMKAPEPVAAEEQEDDAKIPNKGKKNRRSLEPKSIDTEMEVDLQEANTESGFGSGKKNKKKRKSSQLNTAMAQEEDLTRSIEASPIKTEPGNELEEENMKNGVGNSGKKSKKKRKSTLTSADVSQEENLLSQTSEESGTPKNKKKQTPAKSPIKTEEETPSEGNEGVQSSKKKKRNKRSLNDESASEIKQEEEETVQSPKKKPKKSVTQNADATEEPKTDSFTEQKTKNTVFVGNLPKTVKKKHVFKFFKQFGKVNTVRLRSAPVSDPRISKKVTTITKQFHDSRTSINAYVNFVEEESAKKALSANGQLFCENHHIRVDLAEAPTFTPSKAVFLGNVPFGAEEEQIRNLFTDCGEIENVRLIRDHRTGIGKGFGYVNFKEKESVELALEMNGQVELDKKILRIERCHQKGAEGKTEKVQKKKKKIQKNPNARKPSNKVPTASFQGQVAKQKTKKKFGQKGDLKQKKIKKIFEKDFEKTK